jgi:hypothetical protein
MNTDTIRGLIDYETAVERGAQLRWAFQACKLIEAGVPVNLRTNVGLDIASAAVSPSTRAAPASRSAAAYSGTTATAPAAGTFTTDGVNLARRTRSSAR